MSKLPEESTSATLAQSMERLAKQLESLDARMRESEERLARQAQQMQQVQNPIMQPRRLPRIELERNPPPLGDLGGDEEEEEDGGDQPAIDDDITSIKMKIPSFEGKDNAEEYIEWERKVEQIFECHSYSSEKKSALAASEFKGYATFWWDQLRATRRGKGQRPIPSWTTLKDVMRTRFVPSHYMRDLHNRLARLVQGGRSVGEYFREMEMIMARANIVEDDDKKMARFLGGLNSNIARELEMYEYNTMEELVQKAMKTERKFKEKSSYKTSFSKTSGSSSKYKGSASNYYKGESKGSFQKNSSFTPNYKKSNDSGEKSARETPTTTTPSREIQCFKCLGKGHKANVCPNKRVMITTPSGAI